MPLKTNTSITSSSHPQK